MNRVNVRKMEKLALKLRKTNVSMFRYYFNPLYALTYSVCLISEKFVIVLMVFSLTLIKSKHPVHIHTHTYTQDNKNIKMKEGFPPSSPLCEDLNHKM